MGKLVSAAGMNALVTGASSGIGRGLALRLAHEGARVALVARRVPELEAVAEEITRGGGAARVLPCDVSDRAQATAIAEQVLREFGAVDILVNNAGYGHHRSFLEWPLEDMERMMRVNYFGALYLTKALLPRMVERRRGWLVFLASAAGKLAVPDESAYVASKFAMVGLGESLSFEVEGAGVHVLNVCPGTIRTEFFDAEALRRMPAVAKRMMIDPGPLIDAIIKALRRGQHELVFPRFIGLGSVVRAIAPGFMRWSVRRTVLAAHS